MPRIFEQPARVMGSQLYALLPYRYQKRDHSPELCDGESERLKFHQRFCYVFGDSYDTIRQRYSTFLDWWNPLRCDEDVLPYLSQNFGWPLDESLDLGFRRILIKNAKLVYRLKGRERVLWYLIYAHTGINVRILRPNDRNCIRAPWTTKTTSDWNGELYLDVESLGNLNLGDRIFLQNGSLVADSLVADVNPIINRITLAQDFSHLFPAGSDLYQAGLGPVEGPAGVGGWNLHIADLTVEGMALAGDENAECMLPEDRVQLLTFIIQWPYEPVDSIKNLAMALVDYVKPYRSHYTFIYLDHTPTHFYADFSRADSRDRSPDAVLE